MFKRIEGTLSIKRFSKQIESAKVCKAWREVIEKAYPQLSPHTQATSYQNMVLTIRTTSPAVANELQMRTEQLRHLINEYLKQESVTKILYRQ